MKNYCRGQRENYRDATLLNKDAVLANIEKIREQEKSYKNSLIKHKKNYIEIKVPTRERTLHGISSSYYGYGLERGKYLIVLSYTNDGLTYYSDTIPLFVR